MKFTARQIREIGPRSFIVIARQARLFIVPFLVRSLSETLHLHFELTSVTNISLIALQLCSLFFLSISISIELSIILSSDFFFSNFYIGADKIGPSKVKPTKPPAPGISKYSRHAV